MAPPLRRHFHRIPAVPWSVDHGTIIDRGVSLVSRAVCWQAQRLPVRMPQAQATEVSPSRDGRPLISCDMALSSRSTG